MSERWFDKNEDRLLEELSTSRTCVLDDVTTDGMTLQEVGEIYGVSRERIRQIQEYCLDYLSTIVDKDKLIDLVN